MASIYGHWALGYCGKQEETGAGERGSCVQVLRVCLHWSADHVIKKQKESSQSFASSNKRAKRNGEIKANYVFLKAN